MTSRGPIGPTARVNDLTSGSRYVRLTDVNAANYILVADPNAVPLSGGVDPDLPDISDLQDAARRLSKVEGPMVINIASYLRDAKKADTDEMSDVVGRHEPLSAVSVPRPRGCHRHQRRCPASGHRDGVVRLRRTTGNAGGHVDRLVQFLRGLLRPVDHHPSSDAGRLR